MLGIAPGTSLEISLAGAAALAGPSRSLNAPSEPSLDPSRASNTGRSAPRDVVALSAGARAQLNAADARGGDPATVASSRGSSSGAPNDLTEEEQAVVRELRARDREVRAHEQAHAAVGGQYAGSPTYEYQTGPDGQRYAVGGEVSIDTAPVDGDPEATIEKMEQVKAAALAPAEPSAQDRKVAASAEAAISRARADLTAQRAAEMRGETPEEDKAGAAATAGGEAQTQQDQAAVEGPVRIALNAYQTAAGLV